MRLGKVTQSDPLMVRLNGDTVAQPAVGTSMYVGAEVLVETVEGRRFVIPGSTSTQQARGLAQAVLSGGGNITWSGTHLGWSGRFISISAGKGPHWAAPGFFDYYVPPNGTVIPGSFGASNVTATTAGVPLSSWDALWAIPTVGGANTAVTYTVTNYNVGGASWVIPDHWVLIASMNADFSNGRLKLGTGQLLDPFHRVDNAGEPGFTNGFTHFGGGWNDVGFWKEGNTVHLQGLAAFGTQTTVIFYLPPGYRPAQNTHHITLSSVGIGDIHVFNDGRVQHRDSVANDPVWISLDNVFFRAGA